MKKVLVLFDGGHTAKGALEFANKLNQQERILLTGLFLPSIDYTDVMLYYAGGMAGPVYIPTVDTDPEAIQKNIAQFKAYCVKHDIEHRVHEEVYDRVKNVIEQESRFADLMLMSGELFYSNLGEETQQEYMEDAMHKAQCPTMVLPENYTMPDNVVIAYDGRDSSVFALKQFTYLLPQLCNLPALMVYANPDNDDIPEMAYAEEWGARHFKDLTLFRLEADAKKYFNTWMMDRGNSMVVTGGYSRGGISQLFRKHFVEDVIKDHKLPVFIAHK
jgi:nucleotide-binding universal stress UspA family protein